jgi:hypothetical protein
MSIKSPGEMIDFNWKISYLFKSSSLPMATNMQSFLACVNTTSSNYIFLSISGRGLKPRAKETNRLDGHFLSGINQFFHSSLQVDRARSVPQRCLCLVIKQKLV